MVNDGRGWSRKNRTTVYSTGREAQQGRRSIVHERNQTHPAADADLNVPQYFFGTNRTKPSSTARERQKSLTARNVCGNQVPNLARGGPVTASISTKRRLVLGTPSRESRRVKIAKIAF